MGRLMRSWRTFFRCQITDNGVSDVLRLRETVFTLVLVGFVSGATQAQDRSAEAAKLYKSLEADFRADPEPSRSAS